MSRIKSYSMVKPAEATPKTGIGLSDRDQDKPIAYALIVYFYKPSPVSSFESASQTLKLSLGRALVHFYPFAGRLYLADAGRLGLRCNSAGAAFIEAESDARIADFGDFSPTPVLREALIPSVDCSAPLEQLPLLLVQLTKLGCGGLGLGLSMSHVLVDGTSGFHFLSEWARIARGFPVETPPLLDRSALLGRDPPAPLLENDRFDPPPQLIGQSNGQEEREKKTTITTLHVSKTLVDRLKKKANERSGTAYSRYQVVAGYIWRCACKARDHKSEQLTTLRLQVNFRDRLRPPLRREYFGNAILTVTATARAGDLMAKPLSYATSKVRDAIDTVTDEYVRSLIDYVKIQPDLTRFRTYNTVGSNQGAFFGNPNLEISSWVGLPVHNKDFGWGKEVHAGSGGLDFDGKGYMFNSLSGDGSLDIAFCLQEAHMDAFKRVFYEDASHARL